MTIPDPNSDVSSERVAASASRRPAAAQRGAPTPGPWKVTSEPTMASGDEGDNLAWYSFEAPHNKHTLAEHEANARLMEAAPELLAALKGILGIAKAATMHSERNLKRIAAAESAIAKAEGRTP